MSLRVVQKIYDIMSRNPYKPMPGYKTIIPKVANINILENWDGFITAGDGRPYIVFEFFEPVYMLKLVCSIRSKNLSDLLRVYYHSSGEEFLENRYLTIGPADGTVLKHYLDFSAPVTHIRLTLDSGSDSFSIEHLEFIRVNKTVFYISRYKNTLENIIKLIYKNPYLVYQFILAVRQHGLKNAAGLVQDKVKRRLLNNEVNLKRRENSPLLMEVLNLILPNPIIPQISCQYPIDIIIPVYNGLQYLRPLFDSIIKNTSLPYRLLIADDKSTDPSILPFLYSVKQNNPSINITIIENDENLGFVKTVNRLAKLTKNHFVLLNTDIELPPYWLERLMYPIFNMEMIASTTPFTNAGTICSFPKYLNDNSIFEGLDVETLDSFFQFVDTSKNTICMPTGVGFCMGINKTVYDQIGMFDEIFDKGFGEENDWCMRAIQLGYKNIIVTNLFVYHKHGGSFAAKEKQALLARNLNILTKKHPSYHQQIREVILRDDLKIIRDFLVFFITANFEQHNKPILIIDHSLGGGANHYRNDLIQRYIAEEKKIILLTYDFLDKKEFVLRYRYKSYDILYRFCNIEDIKLLFNKIALGKIFINCLVSMPSIYSIFNVIKYLKNKSGCKIVYALHDYFCICPSYTLINNDIIYCNLSKEEKICNKCLSSHTGEFKNYEKETDIILWRTKWREFLINSDEIICFSNASKEILLKAYPELSNIIDIIPHNIKGRFRNIYKPRSDKNDELRIGVLGAINQAKGAKIIRDLVKYIDTTKQKAKIIVIGVVNVTIESIYFEQTGQYDKAELEKIVTEKQIDVFFIPSIWPETFSYTTEEIMQMGYPLAVFNLGAPAERVKTYNRGKLLNLNEPIDKIFDDLRELMKSQ